MMLRAELHWKPGGPHACAELQRLVRASAVRGNPRALLEQPGTGHIERSAREVQGAQPGLRGVPSTQVVFGLREVDLTQNELHGVDRALRQVLRRFVAQ